MTFQNLDILFEDNHLIIINKRCGVLVQGDKTGDIPLLEIVKKYLKNKYDKKGNVFLGLVNRIDRPTSGIVIFAKTSKALSRMNEKLKIGRSESFIGYLYLISLNLVRGRLKGGLKKIKK